MGDRGSVFVKDEYQNVGKEANAKEIGVHIYTHWNGCDIPAALKKALLFGKDRWGDGPYLTRIVAEHMINEFCPMSPTGIGIAASPMETEYVRVVLDPKTMTIRCQSDNGSYINGYEVSFKDFVGAKYEDFNTFYMNRGR